MNVLTKDYYYTTEGSKGKTMSVHWSQFREKCKS